MKKMILSVAFLLVVGVLLVRGYGGSTPAVMGHTGSEVDFTQPISGNFRVNGNVGVGTSGAPSEKLHVVGAILSEWDMATSRIAQLYLKRLSSGAFDGSALTADVAMGSGLANLVGGAKIKSDGNGYEYLGTRGASRIGFGDGVLSLYTSSSTTGTAGSAVTWSGPGAAPGSAAVTIDNAGKVGIGTATPANALDVNGNIRAGSSGAGVVYLGNRGYYIGDDGSGDDIQTNSPNIYVFDATWKRLLREGDYFNADTLDNYHAASFAFASHTHSEPSRLYTVGDGSPPGPYTFSLQNDGNVVLYYNGVAQWATGTSGSDARLKTDVRTLNGSLNRLLELRGVAFRWTGAMGNETGIGVVAQEVQPVFPELVKVIDNDSGYLGVSYDKFAPVFIEAIKELKLGEDAQIAELRQEVSALKSQNKALTLVICKDRPAEAFCK